MSDLIRSVICYGDRVFFILYNCDHTVRKLAACLIHGKAQRSQREFSVFVLYWGVNVSLNGCIDGLDLKKRNSSLPSQSVAHHVISCVGIAGRTKAGLPTGESWSKATDLRWTFQCCHWASARQGEGGETGIFQNMRRADTSSTVPYIMNHSHHHQQH